MDELQIRPGDVVASKHRGVTVLGARGRGVVVAALGLSLSGTGCGSARGDVIVDPPRTAAPDVSASASAGPGEITRVSFEIPRDGAAPSPGITPWPTELARLPDGHIDYRGYPGHDSALLSEYLDRAAEDLRGFSVAPVVFFRLEGPIDLVDPPAADTSRSIGSGVSLVDVDPASPERGTLYPVVLHMFRRDMRYVRKGTLAVAPVDGFTLRPDTLYAAVVRRSFGALPGGLASSLDLDAVLSRTPRADAASERARAIHAPAVDALESLGLPRGEIAGLAVFRTEKPHAALSNVIDSLESLFQSGNSGYAGAAKHGGKATPTAAVTEDDGARRAPKIVAAEWDISLGKHGLYRVIRGAYCTPNFQSQILNAPFLSRDGGRVLFDGDGKPRVAPVPREADVASKECPGQIRARFVLSVPDAPAPKEGYPLLVTAHGTGGDALSFLGSEDFAGWAAEEGYAAVSTDQPLNGGKESHRPGAGGELMLPLGLPAAPGGEGPFMVFYNPLHPGATSGNFMQAQADAAVLVRLFGGVDFGALRDARGQAVFRGKGAPRIDGRRTLLAGHSQGCQSIAALGALDPRARGVLLSGCGGNVRIGILRRRTYNVTSWIALILGLDPEELTEMHPLMALVQNLADPFDPLAFGRFYWDPPPGRGPQKVLHFEGLRDSYNPEAAAEALAVALRAEPAAPLLKPIDALGLIDGKRSADRRILQIDAPYSVDGHFVLYYVPQAWQSFRAFLRSAAPAP